MAIRQNTAENRPNDLGLCAHWQSKRLVQSFLAPSGKTIPASQKSEHQTDIRIRSKQKDDDNRYCNRAITRPPTPARPHRPTVPPSLPASHRPDVLLTPCRRALFSPSMVRRHWPVDICAFRLSVSTGFVFVVPLAATLIFFPLFFHLFLAAGC